MVTEQTRPARSKRSDDEGRSDRRENPPLPGLTEKQRRELWLYIAVSIVTVELLIAVGAVLYGFMGTDAEGRYVFSFPLLSWGAISLICPTLILLLIHFADVGLFKTPGGADSDTEWQKHLPERMQRIYRIIKGAPALVVLLGIVLLGAALLTLDGALAALMSFASVLVPYVPHIVIGLVALAAVGIVAAAWLGYRTRKLLAEYDFRREVLEKTGVIIVDKDSTPLPPGGAGTMPYAIAAGENGGAGFRRALPQGEIISAEAREILPGEDQAPPGAQDGQEETKTPPR